VSRSPLSARAFFRDPLRYVGARLDGFDTLRLEAGRRQFLVARDPEAVWRVLVTDADAFRPGKWKRRARRFLGDTLNTLDGEEHRRRRLVLQPVLDRRRIAGFAPAIAARVEAAQSSWEDGATIVLRDELDPLALTIAGDVLLSTDLAPTAAEFADALAVVMAAVPRLTPPIRGTQAARALTRVERAVNDILAEHGSRPAESDLVGALREAGVPERTVRGEAIAFLLASVDEPPSALEAACFLLGRNAAGETRLHAELDAVRTDGPSPFDDKSAPPYLAAVVRETLRLFPPARHIDRCPVREVAVAGVRAPRGSNVIVSPLVMHHAPRLFSRSAEFAPERWLEGEGPGRNGSRGAYVPFGAGAHTCIGEPLAWAIMTACLATIGRRWRLCVDADAPPPGPRSSRLVVTLEAR
jgi:cytochrome P450